MLVLRILPLGSNAFLEEMVVRFETEVRASGDVVLDMLTTFSAKMRDTHVNAPELFDCVERYDLL